MRRRLFLLLTVCAFAASCTPDDPQPSPQPDPEPQPTIEFQITSDNPMEFTAEGGECVITYAIANPDEKLVVSAYAEVDWLIQAGAADAGQNEIVYVVEKNEGAARSASIVVTYDRDYEVIVNQSAASAELELQPEGEELPYLSAVYYGNQYGASEHDYNYSIVLSTMENCIDIVTGEYYLSANNTYLLLDLYSSVPAENYNVSFAVPEGEYVFDPEDSATAGTVCSYYSYLYVTDKREGIETHFVSGKVTVTSGFIQADLVAENGEEYHFHTRRTSVDNAPLFKGSGFAGEFSSLTGDLELPFEEPGYYAESLGDYYVVGKNDWYLYLDDYANGHVLMLEVLTPMDDELPVGDFAVSSDLSLDRMVLPGFVGGYGDALWSWYAYYDENGYDVLEKAPIVSGTLSIIDNGDDTYTAVCDFVDDLGNRITGECTGCFESPGYMNRLSAERTSGRPARK